MSASDRYNSRHTNRTQKERSLPVSRCERDAKRSATSRSPSGQRINSSSSRHCDTHHRHDSIGNNVDSRDSQRRHRSYGRSRSPCSGSRPRHSSASKHDGRSASRSPSGRKPSSSRNSQRSYRSRTRSRSRQKSSDRSRDSLTKTSARVEDKLLNILVQDACYFLMKSNNFDNLLLAKAESVWSTPPQNEARINAAFATKSNVILLFAAKDCNCFQGFARVSAPSNKNYPPLPWVLPVGLSAKALSSVFTLDWVSRDELLYSKVGRLRNPLNKDLPVHYGRDGQEIESSVGEALCRQYNVDWSSADAQRARQKALASLQSRGLNPSDSSS